VTAQFSTGQLDDREPVFHRAVNPYRAKGCIYLTGAEVTRSEEGQVASRGQFRIGESCYIDDTGHFNAAEFVICYNQLMYTTLAVAVQHSLLPAFSHWTLDDYWARQLPDVLIHKLTSSYQRPIDARGFRADFTITSLSTRALSRGMLTLETSIRFEDDNGGRAKGEVALALVNAPASGDQHDP